MSAAKRLLPAARPTPAQTAAMSFRWLQMRSSSSRIVRARASSARRLEAERLLAGLRVGDARSRPRTRRRRARRSASPSVERARPRRPARGRGACRRGARRGGGSGRRRRGSGSGRTRSRRRGSARPRPGRRRGRAPGRSSCASSRSWSTSGRSGSWPSKRDAVEVVRLALVPAGGRREVDDRRHARRRCAATVSSRDRAVGADEQRPHDGAALGSVEPGEAPAVGERVRDASR